MFGQQGPNDSPSDTSNGEADLLELKKRKGSPNLPQHIAIIMDGNRRFAQNMKMPAEYGHFKGKETLEKAVRYDGLPPPPARIRLPPPFFILS